MAIEIPQMTTAYIPIGNNSDDMLVESDYFEREFEYQEDDGTALNFTGYAGTCQIRNDAGTLIASPTVATLDTTGIVKLTLASLPAQGTYNYDVQATAGSVKKTLQRGPWQTVKEETQ